MHSTFISNRAAISAGPVTSLLVGNSNFTAGNSAITIEGTINAAVTISGCTFTNAKGDGILQFYNSIITVNTSKFYNNEAPAIISNYSGITLAQVEIFNTTNAAFFVSAIGDNHGYGFSVLDSQFYYNNISQGILTLVDG